MFDRYAPLIPRAARTLFVFAVVITLFMALSPYPPHLPIDRLGDKFEHSLAFVTLAVLARWGFVAMSSLRMWELLSFFGALIEVFQAIPSLHRDCDWKDWVADTIAAGVGLLIAGAIRRRIAQAQGRRAGRHG